MLRQGKVYQLGRVRVVDELQQSLERHFARTDQVGFERFPIWPNVRIIATLETWLREGAWEYTEVCEAARTAERCLRMARS